jgi:hypothetical protein
MPDLDVARAHARADRGGQTGVGLGVPIGRAEQARREPRRLPDALRARVEAGDAAVRVLDGVQRAVHAQRASAASIAASTTQSPSASTPNTLARQIWIG